MREFREYPTEREPEQTPRALLDNALRQFDDTLHTKYLAWEHDPTEEFRMQSQNPTKVGWTFTYETAADQDEAIHPRLSRIKGAACEIITYFPEVVDDADCISFVPANPYSPALEPGAVLKHMATLLSDLTKDMQSGLAVAERMEQ